MRRWDAPGSADRRQSRKGKTLREVGLREVGEKVVRLKEEELRAGSLSSRKGPPLADDASTVA